MKKLIVTTDDFGVIPSIDKAIIKAVNAGKVNSIAAFANYDGTTKSGEKKYKSAIENAKEFLDKTNGLAEIGPHLTITSGRPITGDKAKSMIDSKGYFRGIYEFKRSINQRELKEELNEQVMAFKDANIPITHLSCHHNVFTLFPELYKVYVSVCKKHKLAIRSGISEPKKTFNKYVKFLSFMLLDFDLARSDRKEMKRFTKKGLSNFIEQHIQGKLKTPSCFDSSHYGPIPGVSIENSKKNIQDRVALKHKILDDSVGKLIRSRTFDSMELIIHMADVTLNNPFKYKDIDYPGIEPKYFDSRLLEFKSIMEYDFSKFPKVRMASWKDLKK